MKYTIEKMLMSDLERVRSIYLQGIQTGYATFERQVPSVEQWDAKYTKTCRLVARSNHQAILGWAALSPVSSRSPYAGVAEVSIYMDNNHKGKGIGKSLLKQLIQESEENGFWTLQAGILIENKASIALHKKYGFREVGIREKICRKTNDEWGDLVLLERRSDKV